MTPFVEDEEVQRSDPATSRHSSVVEHDHGKVGVLGSNPNDGSSLRPKSFGWQAKRFVSRSAVLRIPIYREKGDLLNCF
jgi:hypothetical protein